MFPSLKKGVSPGVARANKNLKNVKSAWIENQEVLPDGKGAIVEYPVKMKVTFVLTD